MSKMSQWPHLNNKLDLERFYARFKNATDEWEFIQCQNYHDSHFSHTPCEVCMRELGGERWTYTVILKCGAKFEYEVCIDCHEMIQFGDLNEPELMKIEEE